MLFDLFDLKLSLCKMDQNGNLKESKKVASIISVYIRQMETLLSCTTVMNIFAIVW